MFEIYNEDCLVGMKRIPDGSIDLILTDPPFGSTDCYFDKRISFEPMWKEFLRVAKPNAAIILFSQMPFGAELIMSNHKMFRYEIIWEKSLGVGFLNSHKMPLRCHENLLVFYRSLPTYNPQYTRGEPYRAVHARNFTQNYSNQKSSETISDGRRYPRDVLYYASTVGREERYHPQQKPVNLLSYIILTYTNGGERVLDATMGSGSTGVASLQCGRNYIGFEIDPKIFEVAKRRIESTPVPMF